MKIQQVQSNLGFQSNKKRYISQESHEQLIQILRKMDNETIYRQNENSFESIRTSSLNLKDEKNLPMSKDHIKVINVLLPADFDKKKDYGLLIMID